MNIFESLENLNVSEECFKDIIDLVEAELNQENSWFLQYGRPNTMKGFPKLKTHSEIMSNLKETTNRRRKESHKKTVKELKELNKVNGNRYIIPRTPILHDGY